MRWLPETERSERTDEARSPQRRAAEKTATGPREMSVCLIQGASPDNAGQSVDAAGRWNSSLDKPVRRLHEPGIAAMLNHMVEHCRSDLDGVFHALADATRRSMIRQLASGQRTVTELSQPFDMSLAAASKHVKVLERAGLVRREVDGRVHRCSLDPRPLAEADGWLRSYTAFWDQRLDALADLLAPSRKRTDG